MLSMIAIILFIRFAAKNAVVVFANVEKEDEEKMARIIRKTVKNITWLAGKIDRNRIVLHAFAHLSNSKSSVEVAQEVFKIFEDRLKNKGYAVFVTSLGISLNSNCMS